MVWWFWRLATDPRAGGVPVTSALGLPVGACFQEFYGLLGFEEVMHHGW